MPEPLLFFICLQAVLLTTSVVLWILSARRAAQVDPLAFRAAQARFGLVESAEGGAIGLVAGHRVEARTVVEQNDGELPRYFTVVTAWFLHPLDRETSRRTRELRRELERALRAGIPCLEVGVDDDRVMIKAGPATTAFLLWAIGEVVRVAAVVESKRSPTAVRFVPSTE